MLKAKCVNPEGSYGKLEKDKIYKVGLIVHKGDKIWPYGSDDNKFYKRAEKGYVLWDAGFINIYDEIDTYPYVWDFNRFEVLNNKDEIQFNQKEKK